MLLVGTEVYLAPEFVPVWFRAAKRHLPADAQVVVFDHNPETEADASRQLKKQCLSLGFLYWRSLPHSLVDSSLEGLHHLAKWRHRANRVLHLDIDCPPVAGLAETMLGHLADGAALVTEQGSPSCLAYWTDAMVDFCGKRLPWYPGEPETRFSRAIQPYGRDGERFWFDHGRWQFHDLERRGKRVDVTDYGWPHAGAASGLDPRSRRLRGYEFARESVAADHARFWADPRIQELMA